MNGLKTVVAVVSASIFLFVCESSSRSPPHDSLKHEKIEKLKDGIKEMIRESGERDIWRPEETPQKTRKDLT